MDNLYIDELHKKYNDYINNHQLIGSFDVYLPIFQLDLNIHFLGETRLNTLEEYVCKCIELEIRKIENICLILGLEEGFLMEGISQLLKLNYIVRDQDELSFNPEARAYLAKNLKKTNFSKKESFFFNGLSGRLVDKSLDGHELKDSLQLGSFDGLKLIIPEKDPNISDDRELIWSYFKKELMDSEYRIENKLSNNLDLLNIELPDFKKLLFHKYRVLAYRSEETFKFLAHDYCGLEFIDEDIGYDIELLYHKGYFQEEVLELEDGLEDDNKIFKDRLLLEDKKEEVEIFTNYIMNFDIRKIFIQSIIAAKKSIYIISPWINDYVVNESFKRLLENALKKGVIIKIVYGIFHKDELDQDYRNKNTQIIAQELKKEFRHHGSNFKIKHGNTHEKIFIIDEKECIIGSFNFLSYSGELLNGRLSRNEGSTYTNNPDLIREVVESRFDF